MDDELRKAAQDLINHYEFRKQYPAPPLDDSIEALRAALAKHVATPVSYPEIPDNSKPVARVTGYYGGRCVIEPLDRKSIFPVGMAMYVSRGSADAIDWEGVAADQAMTIAMLKVDYQQLSDLCTRQGIRSMEQEEWQKEAARYRWLRDHASNDWLDSGITDDAVDEAINDKSQWRRKP